MSNAKYGLITLVITLVIITAIMAGVDAEMFTRATGKQLLMLVSVANTFNLAYYIKYRL